MNTRARDDSKPQSWVVVLVASALALSSVFADTLRLEFRTAIQLFLISLLWWSIHYWGSRSRDIFLKSEKLKTRSRAKRNLSCRVYRRHRSLRMAHSELCTANIKQRLYTESIERTKSDLEQQLAKALNQIQDSTSAIRDLEEEKDQLVEQLAKSEGEVLAKQEENFLQKRINYLFVHDIPQVIGEAKGRLQIAIGEWQRDLNHVTCLYEIADEARELLPTTEEHGILKFEYRPLREHHSAVKNEIAKQSHNVNVLPLASAEGQWRARLHEERFTAIVTYLVKNAIKHGRNVSVALELNTEQVKAALVVSNDVVRDDLSLDTSINCIRQVISTPKVQWRKGHVGGGGTFLLARVAALAMGGEFSCVAAGPNRLAIRYEFDALPPKDGPG